MVVSYIEHIYRSQSGSTALIGGAPRPVLATLRAPVSLGSVMDAVGFIDPNHLSGQSDEHVQVDPELNVIDEAYGPRPCVDCGLMTENWCETFFWHEGGSAWRRIGSRPKSGERASGRRFANRARTSSRDAISADRWRAARRSPTTAAPLGTRRWYPWTLRASGSTSRRWIPCQPGADSAAHPGRRLASG